MEIKGIATEILDKGAMAGSEAASLAQKVRFMREALFGRCGARLLKELAAHSGVPRGAPISDGLKEQLRWLMTYADKARPRELRAQLNPAPVVIFTDGASEERVTVGGVMIDDSRVEFFSKTVPVEVTEAWRSCGVIKSLVKRSCFQYLSEESCGRQRLAIGTRRGSWTRTRRGED